MPMNADLFSSSNGNLASTHRTVEFFFLQYNCKRANSASVIGIGVRIRFNAYCLADYVR